MGLWQTPVDAILYLPIYRRQLPKELLNESSGLTANVRGQSQAGSCRSSPETLLALTGGLQPPRTFTRLQESDHARPVLWPVNVSLQLRASEGIGSQGTT